MLVLQPNFSLTTMKSLNRFVDINNLKDYSVKDLKSIAGGMLIGSWKKQAIIEYILKDKKESILEENKIFLQEERDRKLNNILNK